MHKAEHKDSAGIIGYGRFGRLLEEALRPYCETKVYDINAAKNAGANFSSLEETVRSDCIFFCVPISDFEAAVKRAKPHISKGALVMDVCSVKEYPIRIMKRELKYADVIGTHPLFGPDSYHDPKNRKIVLCPVRTSEEGLKKARELMQKLEWTIIEKTPEQHDKDMATSLVLMHVIGRVFSDLPQAEMTTMNYNSLLEIGERVRRDSEQLLRDMIEYNRYAKPMINEFATKMRRWAR